MNPHFRPSHMVSFEVLPPRRPDLITRFWSNVDQLLASRPNFISVTYGAGGTDRDGACTVVEQLVRETPVQPIAHLTCVASPRAEVRSVVERYLDLGVRSFMALRGDPPRGAEGWIPAPGDLEQATDLVALMRQVEAERIAVDPGFALRSAFKPLTIAVATFPGGNPAAGTTPEQEADRLLAKQNAGASFAVTQLFWNPGCYELFLELARRRGVTIPIVAGILPPTDPRRVRRMQELTGVAAPSWLLDPLDATSNAEEAREVGTALGRKIAREVLEAGSPGLHVFTFNQAGPALDLVRDLDTSDSNETSLSLPSKELI